MRYRVLSNGNHFIIQYKRLFWWSTHSGLTEVNGSPHPIYFKTKEEAEIKVRQLVTKRDVWRQVSEFWS